MYSIRDDVQRYKILCLDAAEDDVGSALEALKDAGYDMCEIDKENMELLIPMLYADNVEDIEDILIRVGYDLDIS